MVIVRKVRCITQEVALRHLEDTGFSHVRPFEVITGGLLGDAILSKLFLADGLVWEFEEKPDAVRVYIYDVDEYTRSTDD